MSEGTLDPYKKLVNLFQLPEGGANRIRSIEELCRVAFGKNTQGLCEKVKEMMRGYKKKVNKNLEDDEISLFTGNKIMMCTVLTRDMNHQGNNDIHGWVLHDPADRENMARDLNKVPCHINETKRFIKKTNSAIEKLRNAAKSSEDSGDLPTGTAEKIPQSAGIEIDVDKYSEVDITLIEELKKLSLNEFRVKLSQLSRLPLNNETKKQINEIKNIKIENEREKLDEGLDDFQVDKES